LNSNGQLGLGDYNDRYVPTELMNQKIKDISCGDLFTIVLTFDNLLFSFGSNLYGQLGISSTNLNISTPTQISSFTNYNIIKVSCGFYHTLVLDSNGDVYSFGNNEVFFFF
jgi:RCC1 and BTB domain-containing protein